jgi:hypothetical protein
MRDFAKISVTSARVRGDLCPTHTSHRSTRLRTGLAKCISLAAFLVLCAVFCFLYDPCACVAKISSPSAPQMVKAKLDGQMLIRNFPNFVKNCKFRPKSAKSSLFNRCTFDAECII